MIILAIVEVIIILLLIFLRKRILIAIALIKEASRSCFTLEHLMGGGIPIDSDLFLSENVTRHLME